MANRILSTVIAIICRIICLSILVLPALVYSAQPYLEDADNTVPPAANPNTPPISGHAWPRLMIASVDAMTGNIERYSKYDVIATQGSLVNRIAQLQALYPQIMYFRMFNPHEYLSYAGEDDGIICSQSHGNPFESSTPTTEGCGVYAGHWLYQPGSPTTLAIDSNSTVVVVEDASRFEAGQYVVIYDTPAGSFNNAEHMLVTAVDSTTSTLTVERGYKSTASVHDSGSIVAQHSLGNGKTKDPRNWIYNLGTNAPRDAANRRYIDYLPIWMLQNYKKDRAGNTANVNVTGFVFDTEFHFEFKSKKADVDNDLIQDNGISADGINWWGDGYDAFHAQVRALFPDFYIVGGFRNVRGFDSLNGVQMEGFPVYDNFRDLPPDYSKISSLLSMYSLQMRHRDVGAPHTHVLNKLPTKLYPYAADPLPDNNAPFRFSLGMALLENGYFGHQNDPSHPDMWFDEYAVDVTPGSVTYGDAVVSNPDNESQIRTLKGWLGQPTGLRQRLYDDATFAPTQSLLLGGDFESGIANWTGKALSVSAETSPTGVRDGAGALLAGEPSPYQIELFQAQIRSPLVALSANRNYTLVFSARSSKLREIEVNAGGHKERYMIGTDWQRHVMTFRPGQDSNDFIRFNVGRESSQIWLDSVYVFEGNPNVFRRDFDNGIVVVNATPNPKTIDLGENFDRINGTQDPVNDGSTVNSITLSAYDSALLVRPDSSSPTDTQKPVITINAPTKTSDTAITDTSIVVTDDQSVLAADVVLSLDNSVGATNFNCTQTSPTQVDCTIELISSGDLKINATDQVGNAQIAEETGYLITLLDPDTSNPWIIITAPTKSSNTTITDTTFKVADDRAILASSVMVRGDNTAGYSNLNCTQISLKRVDCTIDITSSGDLKLTAKDLSGRTTNRNENGYLITTPTPDTEKPVVTVFAPTLISTDTITDTTIVVTDNQSILASDVVLRADNTAGVANFICNQTSAMRVDCTIDITDSGDLKLTATDQAGNTQDADKNGYLITPPVPDTEKPVITINAPTKSSTATITDTTIRVTDNEAITAANVVLRADNTAGVTNFICSQVNTIQVNCTIEITDSGDLKISATDEAGNSQDGDENGYLITPPNPDTEKPVIIINAPTKSSTSAITDTTITVTDNQAILASAVVLRADNTAGVANFNCSQTSPVQVDCTIEITASGDLKISATDEAGNNQDGDENGYLITPPNPDTEKPVISINAPTKSSTSTITDTTITVTDNQAILASSIVLRADNSAGVANFNCTQSSPILVDCTIEITASGDLKISATDEAGNSQDGDENGYLVIPTGPDTEKPVITINAPTKSSNAVITDTTITVTDNKAIKASDVILRADNSVGVANYNCTQTTVVQIDCSLEINSSGDLKINATDEAGNSQDGDEDGYFVDSFPDFIAPLIDITAPTKFGTSTISDTTIIVTDDQALIVTDVELANSNTVGVSAFDCTQISTTRVECTLEINSSGDLKLRAKDKAGNTTNVSENGYLITSTTSDTTKPSIQVIAPTKQADLEITDTRFVIKDNLAIFAKDATIQSGSTALVSNFRCIQTNITRLDCTIRIIGSGNVKISAVDAAGNKRFKTETGYIVTTPKRLSPDLMPMIKILILGDK